MSAGRVAVIDIGKTNAKLALVDLADLREVAVLTRPNRVLPGPPWPHFDVEGHWAFLLEGLRALHRAHGIDAISVTTHGAAAALIAADGRLAAPVLDYEHPGPEAVSAAYDAIRPPFAETGSPRLPLGLNLGAQLHWQFLTDPGLRDRTAAIVTYPQFWGLRLTGVAATDVTSLGCHTDLWNPNEGRFSGLVGRLGLEGLLAPPRRPAEVLGPVLPEVAAAAGLAPGTPVLCGIHDSNASLLPHLHAHAPPFSVVSTGTWVVSMAVGGRPVALDPARDTLINVNAFGAAVPSARFMGGREHDLATGGAAPEPDAADLAAVLEAGVMLLPSVVAGSGPFPARRARWAGGEPAPGTAARAAAVALYLALMTERCLDLIGHAGPVILEGPFAANRVYRMMLAAATGAPVIAPGGTTGTSQGAALLFAGAGVAVPAGERTEPPDGAAGARLLRYARAWREAAGGSA
ncbi:MAG: FGGY-family carbohydrate kinase [Rhodobacteraceae bacterium]|nr:FGGY-family carbohydrate kinase [Paracoccaceae bacterium]